jgi:hypothetical protein
VAANDSAETEKSRHLAAGNRPPRDYAVALA